MTKRGENMMCTQCALGSLGESVFFFLKDSNLKSCDLVDSSDVVTML